MQFKSPNNITVIVCTVLAALVWTPIVRAEAVRATCPSILAGATADEFDAHLNKIIDSSERGQAGLFANPQDPLDHQTLGPIAQEVFNNLDRYMVGHQDVKKALALAVQRAALDTKDPNRPAGVFLLGGITGTGKSLTSAALAQAVGLPAKAVTKIKGQEMQDVGATSKLTGAPPGYVGHDEAPLITQKLLDERTSQKYHVNVLLVDEFDRGHSEFRQLLLGVMEEGELATAMENTVVDFKHTIIILTTNLGQQDMQALLHEKTIGFVQPTMAAPKTDAQLEQAVKNAIVSELSPEFRNRLDGIFIFKQPTNEEAKAILNMNLATAQRESFFGNENSRILFYLTPAARALVLQNYFRPEMGGRSLRDGIKSTIVDPMSNLIGSGQLKSGDAVKIEVAPDGQSFKFIRKAFGMSFQQQVQVYRQIYGDNVPAPVVSDSVTLAEAASKQPGKALVVVDPKEAQKEDQKRARVQVNNLQNMADYSQVKSAVGFKLVLQNWDAGDDICLRLAKMSGYVLTGQYFNSDVLFEILNRLPAEVTNCGASNSNIVTEDMQHDGVGANLNKPIMTFEPYALQIVALGVRRLNDMQPEMKVKLLPLISDSMENIKQWMSQQNYPPAYRTPEFVSSYLDQLLGYAKNLQPAGTKAK